MTERTTQDAGGPRQLALGVAGAAAGEPAGGPHPGARRPASTVTERRPLIDQDARDLIRTQLDATLFVEAGAGAGKTTQLSARVVALVARGVPIGDIAAITFTEKAAADLRHKIRDDLRRAETSAADPAAASPFRAALDGLEDAAIGTLHAFAARLLRESPIEAELPPGFGVLDEVGSDIAFDRHWNEFLERLLDDPQRIRLAHYVELPGGIGLSGLRQVARAFADNWDLVRERVDLGAPRPPLPDTSPLLTAVDAFVATADCPLGDATATACEQAAAWARRLAQAVDEFDAIEILGEAIAKRIGSRLGAKANWAKHPGGAAALTDFRDRIVELDEQRSAMRSRIAREWQASIGAEIGRFTLDGVSRRKATGELQFHDLLVAARDVVVRRPDLRRRLHARYTHLLLDEFQDTDPIQLELAVRLAADPDLPQDHDLTGIVPLPGRLFVVGDPKQSIYRFRRADIAQYLAAREQIGATEVLLTTNFRSTPAVLEWVNAVFAELITPTPHSQPAFHPLEVHWHERQGSVTLVGVDEHPGEVRADELRRQEATDIAAVVTAALAERWQVHEADGTTRDCRLGDITVLLPSRTSLSALETALADAGIPYQAENSSLVYATNEIRSLLLALRAVDDPSDELALVSTLRSPLFGCSDRDLFEWHRRGGHWRLGGTLPDPLPRDGTDGDDPVRDAFVALRALVEVRHLLTPSELLQRIVDERRVLELALAGPGARDVFRRVRFVVDQARAWSDAGGAGLRAYLAWTRRQGDDGRYVAEVVLPETDLDSVRIMTVHAAKGLEFPITIVGGLTTRPGGGRGTSVLWPPDGTWTLSTGDIYDAFRPVDEQMGLDERLRLLYVACTRATDHLVVSLHRTAPPKNGKRASMTAAALLAGAGADHPPHRRWAPSPTSRSAPEPVAAELPWVDPDEWQATRSAALDRAARTSAWSATAIARAIAAERLAAPVNHEPEIAEALEETDPGLLKDAVDLELPAWQRGRYGTAVGRAVHAVLQSADLGGRGDLGPLAEAHAAAEAIAGQAGLVAALARAALGAPIVSAAGSGAEHWREVYVAAPIGERIVEGYIDLLVRAPEGLIVVDYKTVGNPADLGTLVERYTPQLAVYGALLTEILGEGAAGARLVFLRPEGATEVALERWADAVAEMRDRLWRGDVGDAVVAAEPARPGSA